MKFFNLAGHIDAHLVEFVRDLSEEGRQEIEGLIMNDYWTPEIARLNRKLNYHYDQIEEVPLKWHDKWRVAGSTRFILDAFYSFSKKDRAHFLEDVVQLIIQDLQDLKKGGLS